MGSKAQSLYGIVISPNATERLKVIAEKTALTKRKILEGDQTCAYHGLLLCGAKGSGKRQFAENLARYAGMDFIELSAASLTKHKEETDVVEAYEDFFQGIASKASSGAIVFIDNAGTLLLNRKPSDNTPLSKSIACFIEHVEQGRDKFMVVLSAQTEEEPNLTAAMASIIQNPIVMFERPDEAQCIKILDMYRDLLFSGPDISNECAESALINLSDEKVRSIAQKLRGASAKELHDLMTNIKMNALQSPNDVTEKGIDKCVHDLVEMIEKRKRQLATF